MVTGNTASFRKITVMIFLQHRKKQLMQRHFTGGEHHRSALQGPAVGQFLLRFLKRLKSHPDMGIEPLAFRGQPYAAVGAVKQSAAKLLLQQADGTGHIGLIGQKHLRRSGKALILGNIIKDPVIIIINIHAFTSRAVKQIFPSLGNQT